MPKYIVCVREVHIQMVEVEADSEESAKKAVQDGGGDFLDNALEYSHTLDPETWTVEEAL